MWPTMADTSLALAFALAFAFVVGWALLERGGRLRARKRAEDLDSKKRSTSTRYGQLSEQFAPFMERWPVGDPQRFRFLGDPIDGVQFTDDAVYLVEIKSAGSQLSAEQKRIRALVAAGRVGWVTFAIRENEGASEVVEPWAARPPARS